MDDTEARRDPKVVLVTGASRYLGASLAARFAAAPGIERVIAVDGAMPSKNVMRWLGQAEFVRADVRHPMIGKVLRSGDVDTVVHAAVCSWPGEVGGRAVMKDLNVLGAMHLFAACQKAESVRRLVVRSTSAVYGYSAGNPARFIEEMSPRNPPRDGFSKDCVEVESYARGAGRRSEGMEVSILRFAPLIGTRMDTELTRYFSSPLVPSVLGRDPRIQLLHEEDALAALERAVVAPTSGTFNIAGDGTLMGSQAIRRAGLVELPLPGSLLDVIGIGLRAARLLDYSSEELGYLTQGIVLDTTKMRTVLGFEPRWTTRDAFDDYVRGRSINPVVDERAVRGLEARLASLARRVPI